MTKKYKWALMVGAAAFAMPTWAAASVPADSENSVPDQSIDGAEQSSPTGLQDIVVTAQRRSESLQKVPIAITAVSSEALEARGVTNILELRQSVPSLNVSYNVGYINPYLRGIGSSAGGPGVENPIAVYVDGVYYGSTASALLQFSNIERVEVLKGPQGTLFGRNATGGLIQVITKDPTQEFSGSARFTYGNYDYMKGEAYLASGVTSTLRGDIAVQYAHQGDGYGRNIVTGQKVFAVDHDLAVRSKWVFEPSDATKFTLIGDYSDTKDTMGSGNLFPGTVNPNNPVPPVLPGRYDTATDGNYFHTNRQGGLSLRWDQDLGGLQLASITAYRRNRFDFTADLDISPVPVTYLHAVQKDGQFSQELQLLSPSQGALTWVVGAYYYHAVSDYDPVDVDLPSFGIGIRTLTTQKIDSLAGFAQGTYEIATGTKLTVGGRYTTEKRSLAGGQNGYALPGRAEIPGFPGLITDVDVSTRYNKFTWRIAVDHEISNAVLAYASYNRGFKSGGYNAGLPTASPAYTPETLDAYEIGLKSTIARTARLNLAAFYYDYKNLQVQQLLAGTINVVNGGAARLYGGEAEFEARITSDFTFNASASYLHTEFTSFPNAPIGSADGSTPIVSGSAKGNRLPYAPNVTVSAGVDQRFDLMGGDLHLNANIFFSGGWFGTPDNVIEQKAYEQINASAQWSQRGGGLSVRAWVKNLTNRLVQGYKAELSDGSQLVNWAPPRTYGVTVGFDF